LATTLLSAALAACGEGLGATPGSEGAGASSGNGGAPASVLSGEALYKQHCASCHGPTGEGATGPSLRGWSRGEVVLREAIETRMPPQNPAACQGACARDVTAYILAQFGAAPLVCKGDELPPRRLRLLNRREYNATIRDLLRLGEYTSTGASCSTDADCNISEESCVAGACQQDPCGLHTFVLPAPSPLPTTVHVAGSFNGWPGTVAAGGWKMTHVPGKGLYVAKKVLQNGDYSYKFVINEATWISDPGNPKGEPDGFGGQNSLLSVACSAPEGTGEAPTELDLAKSFPIESRPKGFSYDNSAIAGLVTSIHVEQYLKASVQVAKLALGNAAKLLPCSPATESACRTTLVQQLGRRAFRRPLTAAELARYEKLASLQDGHETAVEAVVRALVLSPHFLYRSEVGVPQPDGTFRLSPHEIATALSYTFWGTMPDDELAAAADSGALASPDAIEAQARRLLASPRARPALAAFSAQWLGIEGVPSLARSSVLYPGWSAALGEAMLDESRRLVEHVVFDGTGKLEELLTADYSFLNPQLASVYGASLPSGAGKAQLPPERRAGLLTHGSVLASTSHSDQSSPIRRGLFVRERLLCQDLGQPPANAGGVPEVDPKATTRERFRQHSSDPTCRSCHQYIDEVGFGMERFDAIGRYRTEENGQPIPPDGDMNDVEGLGTGTKGAYTSLPELASIVARSEAFHGCFARQAYRFAHGAMEGDADRCALQALEGRFEASGYDVRELWVAITRLPGFAARR
jgi:hypothetical protein